MVLSCLHKGIVIMTKNEERMMQEAKERGAEFARAWAELAKAWQWEEYEEDCNSYSLREMHKQNGTY